MDASRQGTPDGGSWWRREGLVWGLLLVLAVGEYALVRRYVAAEVSPVYPGGWDQAVYLRRSYAAFEQLRREGASAALRSALTGNPTSTLLAVLTQPFFCAFGANRPAALALNFLLFLALQVVTARTVLWRTGSPAAAALALGMLLLARTTFLHVGGGLVDYRPDFGAYCLYGVLLALALRSGVFASLRWSLASGLTAAVLCLYRHITLVYLASAVLATAALLLGGLLLTREGAVREGLRRRLRGLAAAAAVAAAVAVPFFWAQRETIWGYYGVSGQAQVALRRTEMGAETWQGHLLYYPRQVCGVHGGRAFVGLAVLAAAFGAAGLWSARRSGEASVARRGAMEMLFAGVCLAAPLGALMLGRTGTSPAVAGVLLPPLVWLAALGLGVARGRPRRVLVAAALLAVPGGAVQQWRHFGPLGRAAREEQARLTALYDRVGDYCVEAGLAAPRFSTTNFCEHLHRNQLAVLYYERHGRLLDPRPGLGAELFRVPHDEALEQLRGSDVVLLSGGRPEGADAFRHPMQDDLLTWQGELREICERELRPLCSARLFGQRVTVYVRPAGQALRRGE